MTDSKPNDPTDHFLQELNYIKTELVKLNKRLDTSDAFTLKLLQTLKLGEETFDLRVARAHYNLYSGLTHSIEHTIEHHTKLMKDRRRGFSVELVDGKTVLENPETIIVTKTESGYDYARAANESEVQNEGTEPFSKYFDEHPALFSQSKSILVNISTEVPVNVKA